MKKKTTQAGHGTHGKQTTPTGKGKCEKSTPTRDGNMKTQHQGDKAHTKQTTQTGHRPYRKPKPTGHGTYEKHNTNKT